MYFLNSGKVHKFTNTVNNWLADLPPVCYSSVTAGAERKSFRNLVARIALRTGFISIDVVPRYRSVVQLYIR